MRVNTTQTNFSAGQVDAQMDGRTDTSLYANGAESLLNSSPHVTGGVRRRPGTRYLAELEGHSRLKRLQFNESQLYVFAFSDARLDIFDTIGGLVTSLTAQPWDETTMWLMTVTQQGDTTILAYKDFPQQKLVRTGASTFTIEDFAFETSSGGFPIHQPYFKFADNAVTLAPSAMTGSINLTVSSDFWENDHVGSNVRYKGKTCTITSITSPLIAVATVNETLAATTADTDWDENVFSAQNGYARACAFHGRRLWFGGSRDLSRHAFASKTGAFFNFDVGTGLDDESIQAEVAIDQIGDILHLHSGRHLLIMSDVGVVFVPETNTSPVSPASFNPRFQIPYGALGSVEPKRLDGAEIYIQDTGKVVRELIFNDVQQAYTGDAISLVSNSLINDVQDMALLYGHTDGPEQFAALLNADGTMAVYHTIRSEKIAGWFPWNTEGIFESITDCNNELFVSVRREINGSTVYYLEKFDFDLSVDCAISISGSSTDTFTAAHLPNTTVYGVSDERATFVGSEVTDGSGIVVFDEPVTDIDIGLDYTRTILTLPPSISSAKGPMDGELKRFGRVVLNVHDSVSFALNGVPFLVRQAGEDFSDAPVKKSARYVFYPMGWSMEPQLTITQPEPLDFTLLSIWAEIMT